MATIRKLYCRPQATTGPQRTITATTPPITTASPSQAVFCDEKGFTLRVAAYARVSTEQDSQQNSFEAQKDFYENLIKSTQGWTFAGIYSDLGISGTSTRYRTGFQSMMEDCRNGRIDRIITKSVSRFARNTLDSLNAIRELKTLGIGIYFEMENIDTLDSKGEFLISLMSSVSQEESRSISENVRWGKKRAMDDGKYSVPYSRFLGYKRGKDGEMVVDEEGAAIVRCIFKMRLAGYSDVAIAERLTSLHVPTPTGKEKWDRSVVKSILNNKKMKGDALLQKTFKPDFLSKRQKRNRGELEKAYVSKGHDAIIAPALFDEVQGLPGKKNPWSTRMVCGRCGRPYRIKMRHGKPCWECMDSYKKGNPCKNMFLYEEERERIVTEIIKQSIESDVADVLKDIIGRIVQDKDRIVKIKAALDSAITTPDDEDLLLTIKEMDLYPEETITVTLIEGNIIKMR